VITIRQLPEPRLLFATGEHVCPRRGIGDYGVFDKLRITRRAEVLVGGIGTSSALELLNEWIDRCKEPIEHGTEAGVNRSINPDQERMMAKRAHSKTVEVSASHVAYMSHPKEAAKLIEEAATSAHAN
jgi:hypothetical protein